jgi:HK97 family phage prohead protease
VAGCCSRWGGHALPNGAAAPDVAQPDGRGEQRARESLRARDDALRAKAATTPTDETRIETRSAGKVLDVYPGRIITVLAVPYESPTRVEYRGEIWTEVFSRSAFNGLDVTKRRIPVSAVLRAPAYDHNSGHLVGKVTNATPDRPDGLVLELRISDTPAGDETLQLAADDALSPSIGFAASGRDHQLDQRAKVRRVNRAFLDHLSLVPTPAYKGARVLAMRSDDTACPDKLTNDGVFAWAKQRVTEAQQRAAHASSQKALADFRSDPIMRWARTRLGRTGR